MHELEFDIAQQINPQIIPCDGVDIVVCLSGRGTFNHTVHVADGNKLKRNANDLDPDDTYRRFAFAVKIAREQTSLNQRLGLNKPVVLYFNGVEEQNIQLRNLLKNHKTLLGYPTEHFVVDDILMDNTVGQCIGLRLYLESIVGKFGHSPKLLFVSSTYHMPRVFRTFGNDSPLLRPNFYLANNALLKLLQQKLEGNDSFFGKLTDHLFSEDCVLKQAVIMGYGIDTEITSRPGWQLDISGEREAIDFYSRKQIVPSIAREIPRNVITFQYALTRHSLATQFSDAYISRAAEKSKAWFLQDSTSENTKKLRSPLCQGTVRQPK
jgi:hypothetical protein